MFHIRQYLILAKFFELIDNCLGVIAWNTTNIPLKLAMARNYVYGSAAMDDPNMDGRVMGFKASILTCHISKLHCHSI